MQRGHASRPTVWHVMLRVKVKSESHTSAHERVDDTMTAMLNVLLRISLGCCAAAASPGADYIVRGAFEVDTNENTQFLWRGALYLLENIPCYSSEHASRWDPAYANASYARIRRWDTGAIALNVSSSIGYGFLTAFVDEPAGGGAEGPPPPPRAPRGGGARAHGQDGPGL